MGSFARGSNRKGKAGPAEGAAVYLRVSTVRQLKGDVSIPSQRRAVIKHCKEIGREVVAEFVDGATGTDDSREGFQRMIDQALAPDCPFDHIVVYAYSRFYRSGPESEVLIRRLAKARVRVVSVTQPVGDDPSQILMRQMIGILDEHTSRENGKNVRRAMKENAEQGFWNGTVPPLGYRSVAAEERGTKIKKRLEIDPVEAETLRLIFDLYRNGVPGRWPLGIKEVVKILNGRGYRTRSGALFGVGPTHNILTARHYATGLYPYGVTDSKTGEANAPETVVYIPIPPLIELTVFEDVQALLAGRNPHVTAPRVINGPSLLIGIATCALCGAGMTRTGTTRRGRRYSYYTCGGHHQKGETACPGRHIPSEKLDELVLTGLKELLFTPARLAALLASLVQRHARNEQEVSQRIVGLQATAVEAAEKLKRLYDLVEGGTIQIDDLLRQRIQVLQADKAKADAALQRATKQGGSTRIIDDDLIGRFGDLMREKLDSGDVNAKRSYIASVVGTIEVGDTAIRIVGHKDVLETRIRDKSGNVPGFVRRWRAPQDSNLRPSGSKPDTLSS